jgi:hypothetical protein
MTMGARNTTMVGVAALVLGGVVGGSVAAWADADGGVITACRANQTGLLRVVSDAAQCRAEETAIQWNQQGVAGAPGPQGPVGPEGPAGPIGPQGPAGGFSGYEIVTLDFTVPHSTVDFTYVATAFCPPGKLVISGGYAIGQDGVNEFRGSHPELVQDGEGWSVGVGPDEDVDVEGFVYAICVDGS